MSRTIFIAGSLAQTAYKGGLTWCFLQLLLGFQRLGWTVFFLDRLEPEMCVDENGRGANLDESINLSYFLNVMRAFGFENRFSLSYDKGQRTIGLPRRVVLDQVAGAAIINVMGFVNDEEILGRAQRRIFFDIDPGFGQMWCDLKLHNAFAGYDDFITLGQNIGHANCAIPTCGLNWTTTPQPVVLDHWRSQPRHSAGAYTSIGAWRGPNAPIEYNGRTYGLRAHEFRKFMALPSICVDSEFEMALDIHPADAQDINVLRDNRWLLVDPKDVAAGPAQYRNYIAGSKAEFMVPKQIYVDTNSGLLSDRSAYYLASGRPVLARDTGLGNLYPTDEGLVTFSTLEEAAAGVERINRDYAKHARAARAIAEEYFDSDKVLSSLLKNLSIN